MINPSAARNTYWDSEAYNARIADPRKKIRYEAGSPNAVEVACYKYYMKAAFDRLPKYKGRREVLVLGMTPELRQLAHDLDCSVTCVDKSPLAIRLFRDWISGHSDYTERIIQANWLELAGVVDRRFDVVMGDGAFGNILTVAKSIKLLGILKAIMRKGGLLVLRKIIVPSGFSFHKHTAEALLKQFRAGEIIGDEFGFGMRIFGRYSEAYNRNSFILDNDIVFRRYSEWHEEGALSDREYKVIRRYYFNGLNLIPPQDTWEDLLSGTGYHFQSSPLSGRMWYQYYPIYCCFEGALT
jgi:hypothetical protein